MSLATIEDARATMKIRVEGATELPPQAVGENTGEEEMNTDTEEVVDPNSDTI